MVLKREGSKQKVLQLQVNVFRHACFTVTLCEC